MTRNGAAHIDPSFSYSSAVRAAVSATRSVHRMKQHLKHFRRIARGRHNLLIGRPRIGRPRINISLQSNPGSRLRRSRRPRRPRRHVVLDASHGAIRVYDYHIGEPHRFWEAWDRRPKVGGELPAQLTDVLLDSQRCGLGAGGDTGVESIPSGSQAAVSPWRIRFPGPEDLLEKIESNPIDEHLPTIQSLRFHVIGETKKGCLSRHSLEGRCQPKLRRCDLLSKDPKRLV